MAKIEGFSQKQQEAIVKQAVAFWNKSTEVMEPFFAAVNDYERLSRVLMPKELEDAYANHPDRSALVPLDVYNNLGALRAHVHRFLFSSKPYAQLSKDGAPNERDENVTKAEEVLQSMLDIGDFENSADLVIGQALIAGVTACFTRWVKKYERVPVRDEEYNLLLDKNNNAQFEMKPVVQYAETIPIDIRRARIDPSAEKVKDIRIVGFQSISPLSDLLIKNRDPNSYIKFDEEKLLKSSFDKDLYYRYVSGEVDMYSGKGDVNPDFSDKVVEVRDIRGLFRIEQKNGTIDFRDLIVLIGNETELLGVKDNDLPIKSWELFDFPAVDREHGRLYTMGVVEPVMDSVIEKFIKKNQSIDEANRSTYDRYVGDKSATQDLPDVIEHTPEQLLKVDLFASGARSIRDVFAPIPRQPQTQDTFNHAVVLTDDIQQGMKLNDYRQGLDPSRKETATAVDALVGGGQTLLEKLVINLKNSWLAPAWRKQLILYDFFLGHKENTITNNKGDKITINPGELQTYYKVDIDVQTSVDRPGMIRRFVEMYPLMLEDPYFDGYEIRKIAVEVLKLPNADKILPPNEHMQFIIDRENAALGYGIQLPVSPYDNHQQHMEVHMEYVDYMKSNRLKTDVIEEHIVMHQDELMRQQASLGNTKNLGGNSGQMSNPESASIKKQGRL